MTLPRNGALDDAKLLAACGIVWFHAGAPGASYGYAGLAFFLVLLVVLTTPAAARLTFAGFLHARAMRLLVPWAAASLFYGAMKLGEVWANYASLDTEFAVWMWLTGPALHLWFLPFAFVAGAFAYGCARLALALPGHLRLPLAIGCAVLCLVTLSLPMPEAIPLAQWLYAMPPICLGLVLLFAGGSAMQQMAWIGGICLIGLSAGWAGAVQLVLAGLLLVLCTALPRPATRRAACAGRMALTVYLLHPAVMAILLRAEGFANSPIILASTTIAVTLILARLLDHWMHPLARAETPQTAQA